MRCHPASSTTPPHGRHQSMSIGAMNAVWKSDLEGTCHRFVLLALADRADDDGYCWPGVTNLMDKTGLSRSAVKRSIRHLEGLNLLSRAPRFTSEGDQDTNMYRINLELLQKMERLGSTPDPSRSEHAKYFACSQRGGSTQTLPPGAGTAAE